MSRGELERIINIGPKLAAGLRRIGIADLESLRERGAIPVWDDLRQAEEFDCVHSLLALTGALAGVRWHELPDDVRADLSAYVRRNGS